MSCFLVDMEAPAAYRGRHPTMMGDAPGQIYFENVACPQENRIGNEGEGFSIAQGWINEGRIRGTARAPAALPSAVSN